MRRTGRLILASLLLCLLLTGCVRGHSQTASSLSGILYRGQVYTRTVDQVTASWGGSADPQPPGGFAKAGRGWGLEGGPADYSKASKVQVYTIAGQPTRISCDEVLAGGGDAVWLVFQLDPGMKWKP